MTSTLLLITIVPSSRIDHTPRNPSPHPQPRQDAHPSHDLHARVKLWIPGNANAAALRGRSGSYDLTVSSSHCKISTASPQERRSRGPTRDVERRFALPWFIYSLNSMASSRYQISSNQQQRNYRMQWIETSYYL